MRISKGNQSTLGYSIRLNKITFYGELHYTPKPKRSQAQKRKGLCLFFKNGDRGEK